MTKPREIELFVKFTFEEFFQFTFVELFDKFEFVDFAKFAFVELFIKFHFHLFKYELKFLENIFRAH